MTSVERKRIRGLVKGRCANYDRHYKICLPLDAPCYMLHKWWTGALCRYFAQAVLPAEPQLERTLTGQFEGADLTACAICGKLFPADGRRRYCSPECAERGRRRAGAGRARKYRWNKRHTVTLTSE